MDARASYLNLIAQVDDLIGALTEHEDDRVRERTVALLSGLDALHRKALERLVERLGEAGGAPALEQAAKDPVVGILLGLYDLADLHLPDESRSPQGFVPFDDVGIMEESS